MALDGALARNVPMPQFLMHRIDLVGNQVMSCEAFIQMGGKNS